MLSSSICRALRSSAPRNTIAKTVVRTFSAAPAAAHPAPVAKEVPHVHDPSEPPTPTGPPQGKLENGRIMPLAGEVFSVQFAPAGMALVVEPMLYDSLEWVLSSPPPIHQFIEPPIVVEIEHLDNLVVPEDI